MMIASQRSVSITVRRLLDEARLCRRLRRFPAARALLAKAVELAPASIDVRRAQLEFLVFTGAWDEAQKQATELRNHALLTGHERLGRWSAHVLGVICREQGRWDEAARWQQQALSCDPCEADLIGLANDAMVRGKFRLAWKLLLAALQAARQSNKSEADAWGGLGNVAVLAGRGELSERLYRRSLRRHHQSRDRIGIARDLLNLSRLAAQRGDWSLAKRRAARAELWASRTGLPTLRTEARVLREELPRHARRALTVPANN